MRALKHFGIEEPDETKRRLFVGPPLDRSFIDRYGLSEEQAWEAIGVFRQYYNVTGIFENSVYPGIEALLKELKANGLVTAIASSKPQPMIHKVLEHFGLKEYFDVIVGCELDGTRSTKSEVVKEVLALLGDIAGERGLISSGDSESAKERIRQVVGRSVMVGDRSYDVEGAHSFEIPCIGVLYGYGTRAEMEEAGADYIAKTVEDIGKIVLGKA
jgi:phosphoglycolate phosphatase